MYNDDTEQHPKIEPTTPAYPPVQYPVYSDMRQRTSPHDYPNIPPPPRKRNGRRWLILSILAFLCLDIILAGIWLTDYNLRRADTAVPALSALYRQLLSGVFGYIAARVPDHATVEDLTSD